MIPKELERRFNNHRFIRMSDSGRGETFLIKGKNNYILRIGENQIIQNNFKALSLLKPTKRTPEPIAMHKNGETSYSIESFIKGNKISEENAKISDIKKMVNGLKAIQIKSENTGSLFEFEKSWEMYFLYKFIKKNKERFENRTKNKGIYHYIIKNFSDKKDYCLLHGDFCFGNSLFNKDKIYFFDFESAYYGYPVFDVGYWYFQELVRTKFLKNLSKFSGYSEQDILFYALCVGFYKTALHKDYRKRYKKLEIVYNNLRG